MGGKETFQMKVLWLGKGKLRKLMQGRGKQKLWINIAIIGFLVIWLGLSIGDVLRDSESTAMVSDVVSVPMYTDQENIEKNMATLLYLQEELWMTLSAKEKLIVLQKVADIEAHYLGISHEISLDTGVMNERVGARYSHEGHRITMQESTLNGGSAYNLVRTICHEVRHAYQYNLVEAYEKADEETKRLRIFREAKVYRTELANYISIETDYAAYYEQACEEDARDWAEDAAQDYFRRIEEYLTSR